ncbi:MAG: zinc ribbon domain-containing protein [Planctomycetota bacterium]
MPTYDYECAACGHRLEIFQPMNSEPKKTCPECKKKRLERQIGAGGGIIFKGSGFYETDYRSDSYKKAAKADQDAASGKSSSDSKKSDSGGSTSGSTKPTPSKES